MGFKYFLLLSIKREGIKSREWIKPQVINVQFAPCQNPDTKKIINTYNNVLYFPSLEPPRGIYTAPSRILCKDEVAPKTRQHVVVPQAHGNQYEHARHLHGSRGKKDNVILMVF